MRTTSRLSKFSGQHYIGVFILCILCGTAPSALAVTIDFNDLVPFNDPADPCFCDNPLTDQYASKGVLFSGSYFEGESHDGGLTYENRMLAGPDAQITFIGNLPTFVEMYVTSVSGDAVGLTATGPNGWGDSKLTPGFNGSEDDPPAIPNFLMSFSSASGIQRIDIGAFYDLRISAAIDNLTFTDTSVPEPSSLALLMAGLVPMTWRGVRNKLRS